LSSPAALAVSSGSLERLASLGDAEMREPRPGYRAGHLSFVLTLGRPPVTGSVAENRAAPDSLAHTADATQAQNKKAGPAITGGPFGGGSSPLTRPAGDMVPQDCGCRFAPAVVVGALPDQLTGWRKS